MNLIALLFDIGNLVFFLAGIPQLLNMYKFRKQGLQAISTKFLLGYSFACFCFSLAGFLCGGYITGVLNIINIILFLIEIHWKRKYRNGFNNL